MKILHVPFTFPPDPSGGTEVYVDALCRALTELGVECVVAAPGPRDDSYEMSGLRVRRFACAPGAQTLDALYGGGDSAAAVSFARVLGEERPDLLHQHALSPACSVRLVRQACGRGLPVVFTYHTPTVTCQRGTLLRFGSEPCTGRMDPAICTPCVLDDLGLNPLVRRGVALVPAAVGRGLAAAGRSGGIWTALRLPLLMQQRVSATQELLESVHRFVSLTPWSTRVLQVNGVPAERIVFSPHGIAAGRCPAPHPRGAGEPVRLLHVGRIDPAKGTAVLIRALALEPGLPVQLDIHGIEQGGPQDGAFVQALRDLAAGDPRIRFLPPFPHAEVFDVIARHDAVVVPSQWFETGPLIVLEAKAVGVPIIGSDLGGIADKVTHDVDGLLVAPFHAETAWKAGIARCVGEPGLLDRLRRAITAPRSMGDVADQMRRVYDELLGRGGTAAASAP